MDLFAVNGAEINGNIEIWSWYGTSDIQLVADGGLMVGAVLSGQANVAVASSCDAMVIYNPITLAADIVLTSTGEALYGRSGSGESDLYISSDADGTRWVMGESASDIVLQAAGEASVVAPAAASFEIVFSLALEERVTPAVPGEGVTNIALSTLLTEYSTPVIHLEGELQLEVASIATPWLRIQSPAGASSLALTSSGDARLGEKIYLEANVAELAIFATGDIGTRHYVRGSGDATIAIQAAALAAGKPPIPTTYMPAPRGRTIIVQRGRRDIVVAKQNRSI